MAEHPRYWNSKSYINSISSHVSSYYQDISAINLIPEDDEVGADSDQQLNTSQQNPAIYTGEIPSINTSGNFKVLTTDQLIAYFKKYQWGEPKDFIQIHHCYMPDHACFNGSNHIAMQNGIRDSHLKRNFKCIGQHLLNCPDGLWVTGRDFNMTPAGVAGYNTGAFMIEMVGNFDKGCDPFGGKQAASMFEFVAFFLKFFKLPVNNNTIMFHRDHATKTCPGTAIDKTAFCNQVRARA